MTSHSDEATKLLTAARALSEADGADLVEAIDSGSKLLLDWIGYLQGFAATGHAKELLDCVRAAVRDVAGCLSLGLVRPALFSIRVELELFLAWMYFKDHEVEWKHSKDTGKDFPLRASNLKYLKKFSRGFDKRFNLLDANSSRSKSNPYELLSIHVHSTAMLAMPAPGPLEGMVCAKEACDDCCKLQVEVCEYLSDVLVSHYASRWIDLPESIRSNVESRLTTAQVRDLVQ